MSKLLKFISLSFLLCKMEIITITSHERNANENQDVISPHGLEQPLLKSQELANTGTDVEKRGPLCTVGGNVNWYRHCGEQYGSF